MDWMRLSDFDSIASPGLVIDANRVAHNIQEMIRTVGGSEQVSRLRPHVKTYKTAAIVEMQMAAGINRFKAATLAELKMVASAGAPDVLLAYQPVGPNLPALRQLVDQFPHTRFAAVTDNLDAARSIADQIGSQQHPFELFIDVDCGMHRTGISVGKPLDELRASIEADPRVRFAGLHVYDGHIHERAFDTRRRRASEVLAQVSAYHRQHPCPAVIGGGSPTFGIWGAESNWQCSPGTTLLWDVGYATSYPELDFRIAAGLVTRIISKPLPDLLCLDVGYKSIAAEMPLAERMTIPALADAEFVGHSEEHLVLRSAAAADYSVGHCLLAFPKHICPTVALHRCAAVVRNGVPTGEQWQIEARDRI